MTRLRKKVCVHVWEVSLSSPPPFLLGKNWGRMSLGSPPPYPLCSPHKHTFGEENKEMKLMRNLRTLFTWTWLPLKLTLKLSQSKAVIAELGVPPRVSPSLLSSSHLCQFQSSLVSGMKQAAPQPPAPSPSLSHWLDSPRSVNLCLGKLVSPGDGIAIGIVCSKTEILGSVHNGVQSRAPGALVLMLQVPLQTIRSSIQWSNYGLHLEEKSVSQFTSIFEALSLAMGIKKGVNSPHLCPKSKQGGRKENKPEEKSLEKKLRSELKDRHRDEEKERQDQANTERDRKT